MLEGRTVAVVVPAHDEEGLIAATLQGQGFDGVEQGPALGHRERDAGLGR